MSSFREITEKKCAEFRIDPRIVFSPARMRVLVECRREIYQEAFLTGRWSVSQIARMAGNRDHTTVLSALAKAPKPDDGRRKVMTHEEEQWALTLQTILTLARAEFDRGLRHQGDRVARHVTMYFSAEVAKRIPLAQITKFFHCDRSLINYARRGIAETARHDRRFAAQLEKLRERLKLEGVILTEAATVRDESLKEFVLAMVKEPCGPRREEMVKEALLKCDPRFEKLARLHAYAQQATYTSAERGANEALAAEIARLPAVFGGA